MIYVNPIKKSNHTAKGIAQWNMLCYFTRMDILTDSRGESHDVVDNCDVAGDIGAGQLVVADVVVVDLIKNVVGNAMIDYEKELPDHMGAMQRLDIVAADPMTMEVVIQRVLNGESLKQIGRSWNLPVLRFVKWVSDDAARLASYEGALRIRADELMHETLEIAAGKVEKDVEGNVIAFRDLQRDKLMVDTNMKLAAMWDRQRYGGEKAAGGSGITIVVNRGRYDMPAEDTENMVVLDA